MVSIFFFFFIMGLFVLLTQSKSILMILLCFEFLFLVIFTTFVYSGSVYSAPHSVMMVVVFAVAEAAVGLSLLVGLVHVSGNEGVGSIMQIL